MRTRRLPRAVLAAILTCAGAVALGSPRATHAQAFTFETTPLGTTPAVVLAAGMQQLTVATEGQGLVGVSDLGAGILGLGQRSAIGLSDDGATFLPLRFTFLHPVSSVTFAFGDGGGDDDVPITIEAYDSFGSLLAELFDDTYESGVADAHTLTGFFSGGGARYFVARADGVLPNSMFFEVQSSTPATVVPEPTVLLMSASGLVAVAFGAPWRRASRWRSTRHS